MYLNDNYEGGEIEFPNQKVKIKPEAGSILIFPSMNPYIHESKPTSKNEKYVDLLNGMVDKNIIKITPLENGANNKMEINIDNIKY